MTREEMLACLTDRPCDVCKFHTEKGCERWACVFEEEPDDAENKVEPIECARTLKKHCINTNCKECFMWNECKYELSAPCDWDLPDEEENENQSGEEESEDQVVGLYCSDCPYFQFTGEPSDDWYGARCNKDGHEVNPSMMAIQELNNNCPINRG